jgi:glutathione S-transferase
MTIELFAHPFSSYCQKALIAVYENNVPFTYRMLEDDGVGEELASL